MILSKPSRRIPILTLGIFVLVAGLWGGLLRMGWPWPTLNSGSVSYHGALMVGGFLGTLISLERSVALGRLWTYGAPIFAALGALSLITGLPVALGQALLLAGSLVLVGVFINVVSRQFTLFTITMGLGAVAWAVGNALWLGGWAIPQIVEWWIAFLVLTIVGERLELSRFLAPLRGRHAGFAAAVGPYLLGLLVGLVWPGLGWAISGVGMIGMSIWLVIHDLARQTIRGKGLTRFVASCLLSGYFWLALGGVLALLNVLILPVSHGSGWGWIDHAPMAGLAYDGMLHSVLLGFVFAMIFGHAPIIFPAVLNVQMAYHPRFYAHLLLLEISVALRLIADAAVGYTHSLWPYPVRQWAGLFGAIAILLFLAHTVTSISRRPPIPPLKPQPKPSRTRTASGRTIKLQVN